MTENIDIQIDLGQDVFAGNIRLFSDGTFSVQIPSEWVFSKYRLAQEGHLKGLRLGPDQGYKPLIDLEKKMSYEEDLKLRTQALEFAQDAPTYGLNTEGILKRAEAYYEFLKKASE